MTIIEDVRRIRDGYASQAKFADHEAAVYFREFVGRLDKALVAVTGELHPRTAELVLTFASALAGKLREAEIKYGHANGWESEDWEAECQRALQAHVLKGDPLDVAAYAAFCWARNWPTAPRESRDLGAVLAGEAESPVANHD